jgi:hypothetical protein
VFFLCFNVPKYISQIKGLYVALPTVATILPKDAILTTLLFSAILDNQLCRFYRFVVAYHSAPPFLQNFSAISSSAAIQSAHKSALNDVNTTISVSP